MSTRRGISTVAKILLKELEKRFVCVLDPSSPTFDLAATLLNQAYRKLLTSTQKDTAKSMMSSSDNMIDANEVNLFTSTIQFQNTKKLNHHICDSSISTLQFAGTRRK